MASLNQRTWPRLVVVGKAFFLSRMRWLAARDIAAIVAFLLALNALNVANSFVGRNFVTAIAHRDPKQYSHFAVLYIVVFAASTLAGVCQQFVQDRLALCWRDWLTRHLIDRYLSGHAFDRIRSNKDIDNPDQRIAEDVRTFTSTLLSFSVMIVNSTLTTLAFAGVLWSIDPLLLLTAALYAALGSGFAFAIGYRLVGLNNLQLKKEADLRFSLIRVREHEEPLGESATRQVGRRVLGRLRRVVHNGRAIIGVSRNVGFFTSGYHYLVQILPILIVAPLYLRGTVEFGVVTQSAMAFAQLLGAFSLVVAQFQAISILGAAIHRLGSLWEEMDGTGPEAIPEAMPSGIPTSRPGCPSASADAM
jgi:vitamin B12/bleomycin/antimicrobial peptide transport system ATP-binding/permease protein